MLSTSLHPVLGAATSVAYLFCQIIGRKTERVPFIGQCTDTAYWGEGYEVWNVQPIRNQYFDLPLYNQMCLHVETGGWTESWLSGRPGPGTPHRQWGAFEPNWPLSSSWCVSVDAGHEPWTEPRQAHMVSAAPWKDSAGNWKRLRKGGEREMFFSTGLSLVQFHQLISCPLLSLGLQTVCICLYVTLHLHILLTLPQLFVINRGAPRAFNK